MTAILGQVHAKPRIGETWEQAKAFWFEAMDYHSQTEEVVAFHRSEAPTLITEAPARGSKSYSTAHDIIPYCLPTKPLMDSRHAVVGIKYETNKEFEYLFHHLVTNREQFSRLGATYTVERANFNPRSGDMEIVINYGKGEDNRHKRCVVRGLSSVNEETLQGDQWTTTTLSEAAEHPSHILEHYFSSRTWRTYLPTTPKPKAKWLKALRDKGNADPTLGIETFWFPPESNPLYDHENFERQRRLAELRARENLGPHATAEDDPLFAEQFLGRWVYYAGRVLPFSRAKHVIDPRFVRPWIQHSEIWLSTDYGYEDPFSAGLWAVLPNGIYVRFDEVHQRRLSTGDVADRIRALLARHGVDRRRIKATGDPSKPEVARLLRDEGITVVEMDRNAQRDRAAGKRRLADLLTEGHIPRPDGGFYPGLYFTRNCEASIAELEELHYRETYQDENSHTAFRGGDHVFDDCRYFVMSRPLPRRESADRDWMREYKRMLGGGEGASFHDLCGTAAYA